MVNKQLIMRVEQWLEYGLVDGSMMLGGWLVNAWIHYMMVE